MENPILHIDMNNFYASVECLYAPEYRNVPMAVAGDKKNRHGIILAKNMLAKKAGVKTAETIWQAQKKCPNLALISPHFERYQHYSQKAKEIYSNYTDRVESFGLDECWLDVGGSGRLFGDSLQIAEEIRERVKAELGLTVSIGVSFTKTFAKLGSDYKKPDAVTVFSKENYRQLVWPQATENLLFVGANTKKILNQYGIKNIGDIACSDRVWMKKKLGKMGESLWLSANGEDSSVVERIDAEEDVKTIGNSTTLPRDISKEQDIQTALLSLAESVSSRLRKHERRCGEVQITVRSKDFEEFQRQCSVSPSICDSQSIYETAWKLYKKENKRWQVRLLGIRAGKLTEIEEEQISLFGETEKHKKRERLEMTMDKVRERFGDDSVHRAVLKPEDDEG
ncbi:DNA polymerase IV [Scatolibacter rhodanostii]|uniref:DNA polymerase IV n=1 Tax=Scatolibacter rhodanostii TaxID=2014781 RepID=UPI000C07C38C|nr:DNA polymerase IV [Scatolibacter rhodanostii]